MKQIFTFIIFILSTITLSFASSVNEDLTPEVIAKASPTFYQFCQIATLAEMPNLGDLQKFPYGFINRRVASDYLEGDVKSWDADWKGPWRKFQDINFKVISHAVKKFQLSLEAGEMEKWDSAVKTLYGYIILDKKSPANREFIKPFKGIPVVPVITQIIHHELDAYRNNERVLWRYTVNDLPIDLNKTNPRSFSLGLFSGYVFDGHHLYNSFFLSNNASACTYIYLANTLRVKSVVTAGIEGFKNEFNSQVTIAELKKLQIEHPQEEDMVDYANKLYWALGYVIPTDDYTPLMNKLRSFRETLKIMENNKRYIETTKGILYALHLSSDEFNKINDLYEVQSFYTNKNSTLPAEQALFGKGEDFHPRINVTPGSKTTVIYSNLAH